MNLAPANVAELTSLLVEAHTQGRKVKSIDLNALNRVLEHKSEDMTATVQAGITLNDFQQQLGSRGQWLPIDPYAEGLTIGKILEVNASGPRRFGYGTIRDYVIGMTVALADGRLIHSGGKVVKNVAGYDLMKLFIGSGGSLGIITEVTFKVLPVPESERFLEARCDSLDIANKLIEAIFDSELAPEVLDLHNLTPSSSPFCLVLGFAGTEPEVEWQIALARKLGVNQSSSLDYQNNFFRGTPSFRTVSVLPSKLIDVIRDLNHSPFVARAGNGIVYHSGSLAARDENRPTHLENRLKIQFDPKGIFPVFPN
jgi:glycolate oxidase FAD binding subunit